MSNLITSIYDEKTKLYSEPRMELNEPVARRNFAFALKQYPALQFSRADLRLYQIASFDTSTGEIVSCVPPVLIADGKEFEFDEK